MHYSCCKIIIFLILLLNSIHSQILNCNPRYEYERRCICKARYLLEPNDAAENLINDLPPNDSYFYCDNDDLSYHECFIEECPNECETRIKNLLDIRPNSNLITHEMGNQICDWTVKEGESVTENGVQVWLEYEAGVCPKGFKRLVKNICCELRCTCKVLVSNDALRRPFEIDLTDRLPEKERFYNCSLVSEFQECDNDCRNVAADYFKVDSIRDKNLNDIKLFENNTSLADELCENFDEQIRSPGLTIKLRISTEPGQLVLNKEINFGNICCKKPCICELNYVTKSKYKKLSSEKTLISLTDRLNNNAFKSYNCFNELYDCTNRCLDTLGDYFNASNLINSSFNENELNNLNIFNANNDKIGSFLCNQLDKQEPKELIDSNFYFYTSIQTQINDQRYQQKVYMGKLCCGLPCKCELIVKNFESNLLLNNQNIAYNAKLLKDLTSYLPQLTGTFECSREIDICIYNCRFALANYLKYNRNQIINSNSIQNLDIFTNFDTAVQVCQTINQTISEPGLEIYLRHSFSDNREFKIEDAYVGRICCNNILFPANRCKYPVLPTINSTFAG